MNKDFKNLDLVISLATWSKRIEGGNLIPVIKSLIDQKTSLRYKIVLVTSESDKLLINNYKELQELIKTSHVEIECLTAEVDLKSHNKYYYTMLKYKSIPVLTVDDDAIYYSNLIEKLWETYKKNHKCIVSGRVNIITYDNDGNINPYHMWEHEVWYNKNPGLNIYATGIGGILYPPSCLKISKDDINDILDRYLLDDDTFLKYKSISLGIKTILCNTNERLYKPTLEVSESFALCKKNVHGGLYKKWISNMIFDIENTINICMILDSNYIDLTLICINSIIESKDIDTRINFYIFGDKLDQNQMSKFFNFINDKIRVYCYIVNSDELVKNTKQHRYLTHTMYLKFFIPQIIKNLDKILYLDSDIIVKKDLKQFYNTNIDNKLVAAVKDFGLINIWKNGRNTDFYSGQMLLNLKKLREFNFTTKCLKQLEITNDADQEIINFVCKDQVEYLEPIYCFSYHKIIEGNYPQYKDISLWNQTYNTSYKSLIQLKDNSVIWHFHGNKKEMLKNHTLRKMYDLELLKVHKTVKYKPTVYLFSNCNHLNDNKKYESILKEKFIPYKGDIIFLLNTCQPLKMAFEYFDYLKWKKEISINVIMRAYCFRNITSFWGFEEIVRNPKIYKDLYTIQSGPNPILQKLKLSGKPEILSDKIDWSFNKNYPYDNKYISPTSGFLVTNILEQLFKNYNLVLVDFYGDMDNSSPKASDHNWIYENNWLKTKNRIFIN